MLQQSSAFRPFVRQSVSLPGIARRTSKNNVTRFVASASTQWNNMIEMIFTSEFAFAIVALSLLCGILLHHVLSCVLPVTALLLCAPFGFCQPFIFGVCFPIAFATRQYFLAIFAISSSSLSTRCLWICMILHVHVFAHSGALLFGLRLLVKLSIVSSILINMLFVSPSPFFSGLGTLDAIPFSGLLVISPRLFWIFLASELSGLPGIFQLFVVVLRGICIDSLNSTRFALCNQLTVAPVEVLRGWREFTAALRAALERIGDIQHCNLLSLRLGFEMGAAPRNAVVRRVIRPSLALPYYTTNGGVY